MRQDVSTGIGLIIVIGSDDSEVMICQFSWEIFALFLFPRH